nr:ABC transporter permease [Gemmatimonadota bacterium]
MRILDVVRLKLRTLLRRDRVEGELDEELRFHVQMQTEENIRAGMSPKEARRQAAITFGGVERHKEEVREAHGTTWLSGLSLDLKLGARMLIKHPGLTLVGGLGMAVAIAISSGAFAFFHSHLYPRIPLDEGERIVALENQNVEVNNEDRQVLHDFFTWREQMRSVQDIGAFRNVGQNLITPGGPPELVQAAEMTAAGFTLARVPPLLGRYLVPEDERPGAPPIVVIGHDVWKNRFAGDPAIVGRQIRFGNTVHTVVGVMPEDFAFPINHSYWTPMRLNPVDFERGEGPEIHVFGRLAPGVTMEEAQAELTTIGRRTAAAFPVTHAKLRPHVWSYTHSIIDIQGISLWGVSQMQLMVSLLLLVTALNVAVLVYARTAMRRGEISVRSALGASRWRIVAQLFAEALVLSGAAAVVGLALAQFGVRMGNSIMEEEMSTGLPFWTDVSLRPATVLYTVGLAVVAAVIVGVLPALQATGKQLQADLRQLGGGTGMRLGRVWTVLIVAQVAIAVAALPAAVNMGWSEIRNATTRPTYPAEEFLVALRIRLEPEIVGEASPQEKAVLFGARLTELMRRLEAEPEVVGASFRATLPERGDIVEVEGVPAPPEFPAGHSVGTAGVDTGNFELFGTRMLTGRQLGPGDLG